MMITAFKAEVIADSSGTWAGNALVFRTREAAERYVNDLSMRWTAVRDTRVVEIEVDADTTKFSDDMPRPARRVSL
jgi:hypothetical protein